MNRERSLRELDPLEFPRSILEVEQNFHELGSRSHYQYRLPDSDRLHCYGHNDKPPLNAIDKKLYNERQTVAIIDLEGSRGRVIHSHDPTLIVDRIPARWD